MERENETQDVILPTKELKSNVLKNGLEACVLTHIVQKHEVIALRILVDENQEYFETRRLVERKLSKEKHVVGFMSCLTAIKTKACNDEDEEEVLHGLGVWIIYDWPEYGTVAFENFITKMLIEEKISVLSCKSVKPRGMFLS